MTTAAITYGGLETASSHQPWSAVNTSSGMDNSTDATFPMIPACYFNPHIPTTRELLEVVMSSPSMIFVMVLAILLVIFTMLMYIEGQIYIFKRIPGRRKVHLSFIFSLYPVFSATSLCGFYIPKAHIIAKFTSEIWLCLVLFQFVLLVGEYYGTRDKMLTALHGNKIPLAGPPCCCCFFCCLPSILINEKNVGKFARTVKFLVLQVAVLRPILWFIAVLLWVNGNYTEGVFSVSNAYPYMTVIALVSNLVALQALVTFFKISQDPLSSYKVKPKFFTVQFVLIITSVQSLITSALAKVGVIKCLGPYSPGVHEKIIVNFTVIVEMFFFMILAAMWYRRVEGNVDHDLIERQTYKRLSRAYYKKNPAEQMVLTSEHDAANDRDTIVMTPSPVRVNHPDCIWQYKEPLHGNGVVVKNGSSGDVLKEDKPHAENQQEAHLNNNTPKSVTHILPPSTLIMDSFATSKETDV